MASQFSFDIVSTVDLQEIDNTVNQAKKEMSTRYDFRGSKSLFEFLKQDNKIRLIADDDLKLKNMNDILKTRLAGRKISQKALDFKTPEKAFDGCLRQDVELVQGIPQEKAKEIVRDIKQLKVKAQASIQGDQVRVTSKSKDELQSIINLLKNSSISIPLQFVNFR